MDEALNPTVRTRGGWTMTDRENRGGPVNSDVSYFRDAEGVLFYDVRSGTCPRCRSHEVWEPMQTTAPPAVTSCLRCGLTAPSGEYRG